MNYEDLARTISLFRRLVSDGPQAAFTAKSLDITLAQLQNELEEESEGLESLVDYWDENLAGFRQRLLSIAVSRGSKISIDNREFPLITEDVTARAWQACPPRPKYRMPAPRLPELGTG